jgi:hypothetical protein
MLLPSAVSLAPAAATEALASVKVQALFRMRF